MYKFYYLIFFLLLPLQAFGAGVTILAITSEPQTIKPGDISGDITLQSQAADGSELKLEETVDLTFTSTSLSGEFLNSSGDPVIPRMNKGTANRTFYYRDSASGIHTLRVKAVGRDTGASWEASQNITVSGALSPSPPTGGSSSPSPPPSSSVNVSGPPPAPIPSISAYAGEDLAASVGSTVKFIGQAFGLKNEPLENARFWWNFGDGAALEGKSAAHVFRSPGTYTVGLHVSSGGYAASDYLRADITPNQVVIAGVREGADGEIRLRNGSDTDSEIGGWILENGSGGRFIIPEKTVIGAEAEIGFPHALTQLLLGAGKPVYPFTLRFGDYREAYEFNPVGVQDRVPNTIEIAEARPVSPPTENVKQPVLNNPDSGTSVVADTSGDEMKSAPLKEPAQASAAGFGSSEMFLGFAFFLSAAGAAGFFFLKRAYFQ